MEKACERTEHAAGLLWTPVTRAVESMAAAEKAKVEEIRLRVGQPLSVFIEGKVRYLAEDGALGSSPEQGMKLGRHHIEESFRKLCGYAVHSHEQEIAQGFLSVEGGHRAGLGGTGVVRHNGTFGLRDITSVCLRVARQVPGAADRLVELAQEAMGEGILIAGAPGSGKTTILRDLARQLSCRGVKVAVVDERCELSGAGGGELRNDLGPNCVVLAGMEKSRGLLMAVRCLSPQVIFCDELGSQEEIQALCAGLCSGVTVISTIHAGSWEQLKHKPQFRPLAQSGAFRWAVLLSGPGKPFSVREVGDL